jgi:hypothetical protein
LIRLNIMAAGTCGRGDLPQGRQEQKEGKTGVREKIPQELTPVTYFLQLGSTF